MNSVSAVYPRNTAVASCSAHPLEPGHSPEQRVTVTLTDRVRLLFGQCCECRRKANDEHIMADFGANTPSVGCESLYTSLLELLLWHRFTTTVNQFSRQLARPSNMHRIIVSAQKSRYKIAHGKLQVECPPCARECGTRVVSSREKDQPFRHSY